MLPRKLRLSRQGFGDTRGLKRVASPHFSLSYGENPEEYGVGVVISKKVVKGAVGRHLLKRRIMSVMRPYALPGRVLIIHTRPGAGELLFSELERELKELLSQLQAID